MMRTYPDIGIAWRMLFYSANVGQVWQYSYAKNTASFLAAVQIRCRANWANIL